MDDKNIMENILLTTKGVCDLYLHGTIESGTKPVNTAFNSALNASLIMQDDIYQTMTAQGWYPTQTADQNQIQSVKQKFSNQ